MDIDRPIFISNYNFSTIKNYHLYRRRIYFTEKLRLLSGIKQSFSSQYNDMIKHLQNYEFNNIEELIKLLKKHKFHKFYKYVHSIYFDIKKERLIKLSPLDIEFLINQFI